MGPERQRVTAETDFSHARRSNEKGKDDDGGPKKIPDESFLGLKKNIKTTSTKSCA
ncbi:MAG: hypothetical protein KGJ61_07200 [Candidatus Omnitrophica bacterium]|nr:hypothetical protein [Candidatus Omnitrophota bacterium]